MRCLALFAFLTAAAVAAPIALGGGSPASVRVASCKTGNNHSATFKGSMRSVDGSERMAMRFKLLARYGKDAPQAVEAPALRRWHRSRKGVTRYSYSQRIKGLAPGGSYRARVKYRWLDEHGKVIKRTSRLSGACVQDGALPNLTVSSVSESNGDTPGTATYSVWFANTGKAAAEGFDVSLVVDGAIADSRDIERLEAGETEEIELNGPECTRLRAVVDSDDLVRETVEDDNSLRSRC